MAARQLAPIAYFAFNRPDHTERTLRALQTNPLAAESTLCIFCDGPRSDETEEGRERIDRVRHIAASEPWCGKVILRFREENLGLSASILGGIREVLDRHDRIVVVEDDVLVSPGFLDYMNDALDLYSNDEQVMHVSAYSPLDMAPADYGASTFFFNHTWCWGWGTWLRAWRHMSTDGADLRRRIDRGGRKAYINLDGAHEFYGALAYLDAGRSQDWNCYWHVSVALRDGLCLQPVENLVNNIGFDGSGTQCSGEGAPQGRKMADRVTVTRIPLVENSALRRRINARPLRYRAGLVVRHMLRPFYLPLKRAWWRH